MAGEILDNKGRGEAGWEWPAIHPEGRKFGLIAAMAVRSHEIRVALKLR